MASLKCPDSVRDMQTVIDSHCMVLNSTFCSRTCLNCVFQPFILYSASACLPHLREVKLVYIQTAECLKFSVNGMVAHQYRNVVGAWPTVFEPTLLPVHD